MTPILIVLFRWIHITTACVAVGGVFFLRIVFPIGLRVLDAENAHAIFVRTRRVFKIVTHTCILLFLISGTYNAIGNWHAYTMLGPAVGHSLFGVHTLLALFVLGILLWLLAGKEPRANHQKWLAVALALMLLTVAAASVLKYAREHPRRSETAVQAT